MTRNPRREKAMDYEFIKTATLGVIPLFLVLGLFVGHRKFEAPRFWKLYAFGGTLITVALSTGIPIFWGNLLGDFHLFDLSGLGIAGGTISGVFVYELLHYAYHRLAHRSDFLWRLAHQMHHSAESLDAFGAQWLHPVDTAIFTTLSSLVFFPLMGLPIEAGVLGGFFLAFNAMFQHANMKTPRWLGYVIQRPESHSVHHGRHRSNYADLPLIDILFGTFENPAEMERKAGFYNGASTRVLEMLVFRDVSEPKTDAGGDETKGLGLAAA
jgi:sterol desaturase/sphingolipid hydroxylase (fatty acid hydroxylase superfamily)